MCVEIDAGVEAGCAEHRVGVDGFVSAGLWLAVAWMGVRGCQEKGRREEEEGWDMHFRLRFGGSAKWMWDDRLN